MKKLYQLRTFLLLAVFSLLAGTALAASETFDFSAQGYSNQQTVTSVSATNFTVAFDKGTNSNGQQYYNTGTGMRLYGGNIMTIASDKTITAIEFTFTQNDKDMTPDVGTYTKSSASWTGSATSVAFTVESGKGHNRLKAVTVTYEDATPGDTRAATTLTFNPASYTVKGGSEAAAFVAPTPVVMDDTDLEIYPSDGELSYGINVTSGDASLVSCDATTGYVLIDEAFVGAFTVTASYAGNNSYKPSTGSYTVTVTYPYVHAGTATDPFTVAEAIAKAKENGTSSDGNTYYTAGIISQVDGYNSTYHSITYWISDDGTTDNQLEVYSGKGLESADFAAQEDLAVGYSVVVAGELKNYNGQTPEYDKNNYLVSLDKHENPDAVAKPTFSPAAGEVAYETEVTVSAAEGCTLKYTTDGSDPATSETAVTTAANTATVTIYDATTIRAIAYDADGKASEEATAEYTIALRDLTAPVISVASGEVPAGTVVTVSYSDPEATLLVTTDGSDPAEFGGDSYDFNTNADLVDATTGTLTASYTIDAATTLRAVVMDNTMGNMSDEATATYTLGLEVPSFQFVDDMWQNVYTVVGNDIYYGDDNAIQVYVCGSTTNATWYTLDGSDPTTSETAKKITATTMAQRINMFGMPGVAVNVTDGQTLRAATYDGTNFSQVVEWGYTARAGKYTIPAGTYTKVTSNADITDGANYILVYEMPEAEEATGNDAVVFTGELSDTKTKYGLITTTARATDGSINISNLSVTPVVINASTDATVGGYTMTVNGEYLAWTSGNSLTKQEDAYYWNIDVTATEAKSIISSVAQADRFLQYNTGSPRFACYTGSQKGIALYKEAAPTETEQHLGQDIVIGSTGFATLYWSDKNIELPTKGTVCAYTMVVENNVAQPGDYFYAGDVIPAMTAVVLENQAGKEAVTITDPVVYDTYDGLVPTTNLLRGFDYETTPVGDAATDVCYKLSLDSNGANLGFYRFADGEKTGAHKAFLAVPADQASGIRAFLLNGDVISGISLVNGDNAENGKAYDLSGRRVKNADKGIFIVNGKKVIK
ncbi:MAG: chitobiase/beta-hexosaminidase C-terminal domain-containing protein [Alloprevotella sp.]|nr:chitobiase/beta-hexosaminidase C-terminal domain-containing protein [Alloprevotella sp.]